MIKVSDYIAKRLVEQGVRDVFMISGGGAMHLNNSIGKNSQLNFICSNHEQASAIGAEGYSRVSGELGVVCVTSGPGGTNTLTGVIGQWLDSVPVLYISGQVKYETCIEVCRSLGLRQFGDQEINIIDIVKPITKYAVMLKDPKEVKRVLDKAVFTAKTGRPGPVWIDIPLNVQSAEIDEEYLEGFDPGMEFEIVKRDLKYEASESLKMLKSAKRPVLIAGHGIRIAHAEDELPKLVEELNIPVLSTFNGFDLIDTENACFIGRIGSLGDRAGNFALQNADLILSIGSRNNIRQISYDWRNFGVRAKKIIVDIDEAELNKPTIRPDLGILCDAGDYIEALLEEVRKEKVKCPKAWMEWCLKRKARYPVVLDEYRALEDFVQPYYFIEQLTMRLRESSIVVCGNGTACVAYFQAGIVKKGQRVFWNSGCASMGYDLPAAIGACFANNRKQTICIAGDGSLQMNIQELETIAYHNLPIKIFVLNNFGYSSIRQTHDNFFGGFHVGCDPKSGVGIPSFVRIARAYGIEAERIHNHKEIEAKINNILEHKGPILCEIMLNPNYIFSPKLSSDKLPDGTLISKPLEDMYPFLDREEFKENIIID